MQIIKMIKACQSVLEHDEKQANCTFPVTVEYPLYKSSPRTNEDYCNRFHEIFSREEAACCSIAMEYSSEHWFAFEKREKTLTVHDSADAWGGGRRRLRLEDLSRYIQNGKLRYKPKSINFIFSGSVNDPIAWYITIMLHLRASYHDPAPLKLVRELSFSLKPALFHAGILEYRGINATIDRLSHH